MTNNNPTNHTSRDKPLSLRDTYQDTLKRFPKTMALLAQGKPRFFIDHGMIHDRVTGKHVDTQPIEYDEGKFDTSPISEACELLNSLQSRLDRVTEALTMIADGWKFDDAAVRLQTVRERAREALSDIAQEKGS